MNEQPQQPIMPIFAPLHRCTETYLKDGNCGKVRWVKRHKCLSLEYLKPDSSGYEPVFCYEVVNDKPEPSNSLHERSVKCFAEMMDKMREMQREGLAKGQLVVPGMEEAMIHIVKMNMARVFETGIKIGRGE